MRLIRWAGENVSPSDDGRLYEKIFGDGLLQDVTMTPAGAAKINIGPIYGIICGREFTTDAMQINAALPSSGTKYGTIYAEIDTSKSSPLSIKTSISQSWTPTRQDINVSGTVAQVAIGWYGATPTAVTQAESNWSIYSEDGQLKRATVREVLETLHNKTYRLDQDMNMVSTRIAPGLQTAYDALFGKNFETGQTTNPPLFIYASYTASFAIEANSYKQLGYSDFGISTPTDYFPIAVRAFDTGNNNIVVRSVNVGHQTATVRVRNVSNSAIEPATCTLSILFARTTTTRILV